MVISLILEHLGFMFLSAEGHILKQYANSVFATKNIQLREAFLISSHQRKYINNIVTNYLRTLMALG